MAELPLNDILTLEADAMIKNFVDTLRREDKAHELSQDERSSDGSSDWVDSLREDKADELSQNERSSDGLTDWPDSLNSLINGKKNESTNAHNTFFFF